MFEHANKALIAAAFLILAIVIIPIVLVPEAMVAAIGQVYNFITTDMAWLYRASDNEIWGYSSGRTRCEASL